jgi:uncharacterized integral membrane protein (TIGR00698 family)
MQTLSAPWVRKMHHFLFFHQMMNDRPFVRQHAFLHRLAEVLPGILLSAAIGVAAIALGRLPWLQAHGMSALTMAIVLGVLMGNTLYPRIASRYGNGVGFSKQSLLRLGIVLYGFRLTFQDIVHVGLAGVAIDALVLTSTFMLALFVGIKLLKMERDTVILIGAGSAICGAAAVMAAEPVVRAKVEQVTVAVSTVVVFGTLAIFVYPLLYRFNLQWPVLGNSASGFGIYAGSTIHEVAQVVAAARSIGQDAANTAVIAKMVRVMMLAPFLLLLSAYLAHSRKAAVHKTKAVNKGSPQAAARLDIPWFAFAFILVAGLNSMVSIPHQAVSALLDIDAMLLAMSMAALGLTTHASAVRRAGIKPLILAALLFAWLIAGGAAINRGVMLLFC